MYNRSYRLEDKRKYKELLEKAAPNINDDNILNSFSEYSTPVGKLFVPSNYSGVSSRTKKIIDLTKPSQPVDYVDLTRNGTSKTSQRIEKV